MTTFLSSPFLPSVWQVEVLPASTVAESWGGGGREGLAPSLTTEKRLVLFGYAMSICNNIHVLK